jgi:hypothetical protein
VLAADPPEEVADADGEEEMLATGGPTELELPEAAAKQLAREQAGDQVTRRCVLALSFLDPSCPPPRCVDNGFGPVPTASLYQGIPR